MEVPELVPGIEHDRGCIAHRDSIMRAERLERSSGGNGDSGDDDDPFQVTRYRCRESKRYVGSVCVYGCHEDHDWNNGDEETQARYRQ